MVDVAGEKHVPMISLAASAKIIDPPTGARAWVFKTPQNDSLMADAVVDHMAKNGVKTVAIIGFNDAYGDGWLNEMTRALAAQDIKLVDSEQFARADTSVMGQVLKAMAAKPDAILIAGAGTPAVLPESTLRERGYTRHDLPDAWRGERRLPARRRQGPGGHDPARRPGAGGRPAARLEPDQAGRAGLREGVRGEIRAGLDGDVRRASV